MINKILWQKKFKDGSDWTIMEIKDKDGRYISGGTIRTGMDGKPAFMELGSHNLPEYVNKLVRKYEKVLKFEEYRENLKLKRGL